MNPLTLDLDLPTAPHADPIGFGIGWDHARHGLVPPPPQVLASSAVGQGWQAARAVFGGRAQAAPRRVRQWLALRLRAWQEGQRFDAESLTPEALAWLEVSHCPVTRAPLGGSPGAPTAPVMVCLQPSAGYAAGTVVQLSTVAAEACAGCDLEEALRRTRAAERCDDQAARGLDATAWWRIVTLLAFVTPQPAARALHLALRVLPPPGLRVRNPSQALQAAVTLALAQPGWSRRARELADRLPKPECRTDFNLFVGALAPRLLEALGAPDARTHRLALEDAWGDLRVNRRWQLLAAQLGAAAIETWLAQIEATLAGGSSRREPGSGPLPARVCHVHRRELPSPRVARTQTRGGRP